MNMVPKVSEPASVEDFTSSRADLEDSYRYLLGDDSQHGPRRKISHRHDLNSASFSFLGKILHTFGLIKQLFLGKASRTRHKQVLDETDSKTSSRIHGLDKEANHQSRSRTFEYHQEQLNCYPEFAVPASENGDCENESRKDLLESIYGTFRDTGEAATENLANQLKELVTSSPYCSSIKMSQVIAYKVANDILKEAENEPCGLKGCKVLVHLEDGERTLLGEFHPEDGFICTFEVNVVLWLENRGCKSFFPIFACMPRRYHISERYQLSKDKLYTCSRSNSRTTTPVPIPRWKS